MSNCQSFKPSIDVDSEVLILGSMPGVKSLQDRCYYAHPQNRFWKVMGYICNNQNLPELSYTEKLKILLGEKFALWDTIKSCNRDGSSDSDILNVTPNDIRGLLKKYPNIKTVCLNGGKAYSVFTKYFPDLSEKYDCLKMPSTSPANAKFSLNELNREWQLIKRKL